MEEAEPQGNSKYRSLFFYAVIGVVVLLLFLFLSLIVVVIYFYFRVGNIVSPPPTNTYLYMEFNSNSKRPRKGFVHLPRNIEKEEYVSYANKDTGSFVIISNAGGKEYECKGYCDPSMKERRNAGTLTRGLSLVFTAFSAAMATKMAADSFDEICKGETAELIKENPDWDKLLERVLTCGEIEQPDDDFVWVKYDCTGNCVPNRKMVKTDLAMKETEVVGKCEEWWTQEEVFVGKDKNTITAKMNTEAKTEFLKAWLRPFCKEVSRVNVAPFGEKEKYTNKCVGSLMVDNPKNPGKYMISTANVACYKVDEGYMLDKDEPLDFHEGMDDLDQGWVWEDRPERWEDPNV